MVLIGLALAGCTAQPARQEPPLTAAAGAGKQLAVSKGCAGCHEFYGRDAAGPTWRALYGSEVKLTDGSKVLADEAYLRQAVKDPWSQKVYGFGTVMPRNSLSDAEVDSIINYIKALR